MSEPISIEPAQRSVEVIRKPNYDLLINLVASDQSQVQDAVRLLEDRSLQDWPVYSPLQDDQGPLFRVDSLVSPKFFAKERHLSSPEELSDRLSRSRQAVKGAGWDKEVRNQRIYHLRQDVAASSIANEICTSPMITSVLGSPEVEELVRGSGFGSIEFVEPLVGVINRGERKAKTIVYKFVEGRSVQTQAENEAVKRLAKGLLDLFLNAGVVPADLNPSQFLIGRYGKVYLLDSELYFKDN